ncbi:MAG: pantoate--beta-alanine ligase [Caulobacteraceae bacterium]
MHRAQGLLATSRETKLEIIRGISDLRARLAVARDQHGSVGLVPTMGAIHRGHLALVDLARLETDFVAASLFVNPAQFGPGEDFSRYPRDEKRDAALLEAAGCELLFAPSVEEMYPKGYSTRIDVGPIAEPLEGEIRSGHFPGVAAIVAKLLIAAAPDAAVFGEKDYQQFLVIRRLVRDLGLAVRILAAPTVREADGLAVSSRNAYLSPSERGIAASLHAALARASLRISAGDSLCDVERAGREALLRAGFSSVDYFAVREAETLDRPEGPLAQPLRLLVAAHLGSTRLIDNVAAEPNGRAG